MKLFFCFCWKLLGARNIFEIVDRTVRQPGKKTTLISMIRNEKGILEIFCAHASSLFDRVILIDHCSSDGTREYIRLLSEKCSNIEYYCFDDPGYYQSELMTWTVNQLVDKEMPGWVFFLDADEFLPFKSKEEFDLELSKFSRFPVISMPWLNLVPLDMESGKIIDEFFLKPPKPSRYHKIAFQPSRIPWDKYFIAQGNHNLFMGSRFLNIRFPAKNSFPIYHLPIRTKHQLREKIRYGIESYQRMGSDRQRKNGFHWDEIHRIMKDTSLTNEMMAGIAAQYSDTLRPPYERSFDELLKNGYSEIRMEICCSKTMIAFADVVRGYRNEKIVKNNDASTDRNDGPSINEWKIDFDRSTGLMRITG
ncbi:MAG: glycosyltransferase family 2 protein [Nitrosospira sp.]